MWLDRSGWEVGNIETIVFIFKKTFSLFNYIPLPRSPSHYLKGRCLVLTNRYLNKLYNKQIFGICETPPALTILGAKNNLPINIAYIQYTNYGKYFFYYYMVSAMNILWPHLIWYCIFGSERLVSHQLPYILTTN